jgi:hypothetical protein
MGVVTAQKGIEAAQFLDEFANAIAAHRHWEREGLTGSVPA